MIITRAALLSFAAPLLLLLAVAACGGEAGESGLSGTITIDGSSTVYPVSEAMAEEFSILHRDVRPNVTYSGTGGGFKRFCAGEIEISDASRPITAAERALCESNDVAYIEIPVALDGLAVVTNPASDFVACLTTDELASIWAPGSTVNRWSQVRDGFPDEQIRLYGPGTNSGTFDYFTEEILGESGASRSDYSASEDDNVLVQGVEGDLFSLGYFGYAYYEENQDRLKALGVDAGSGCVLPAPETVTSNEYPISRPLFIYVSRSALERPEVHAFVSFYLDNAAELVPQVGYVALEPDAYESARAEVGPAPAPGSAGS